MHGRQERAQEDNNCFTTTGLEDHCSARQTPPNVLGIPKSSFRTLPPSCARPGMHSPVLRPVSRHLPACSGAERAAIAPTPRPGPAASIVRRQTQRTRQLGLFSRLKLDRAPFPSAIQGPAPSTHGSEMHTWHMHVCAGTRGGRTLCAADAPRAAALARLRSLATPCILIGLF